MGPVTAGGLQSLSLGACMLSPHPPFPLTRGRPSRRRLGIQGAGGRAGSGAQPTHRPPVLSTHTVPGVARSPCPACGVGSARLEQDEA